ncbi:hypothetical protein [Dyella tabacisoli]|uniref:Uncharacterized protein n=1 Tax=Dyella tabacisoli TaxID=2282381 RepID=A0A369UYL3_9GAMM|nr:hypothetical protein [Dyella tabacisoli]RDD83429.1 hypothetical protein DVJ77_02275 [Dyella tabacisoli]
MIVLDFILAGLASIFSMWGIADPSLSRAIRLSCSVIAAGALLDTFAMLNDHYLWVAIGEEVVWPSRLFLHAGPALLIFCFLLNKRHSGGREAGVLRRERGVP